jgi:hypothetical protein
MANYAISNELGGSLQNCGASYTTQLGWTASNGTALRRAKIYDIIVGTNGTPADNALVWDFPRQTVAGTATGITPNPLDPADAAALGVALANATAEGTITSNSSQLLIALNQRASIRWAASPGSELVIPAVNANGIVARVKSAAYGSTVNVSMLVQEQ